MPRPRLESSDWWPSLLAEKDSKPLRELAATYGVSVNGLSRALKRAGIERGRVRGAAVGPDAAADSPDPRSIEARDWWSDFLDRKDKQSLSSLATRYGVAEITLQRAMKRTGTSRKSQRGAKGNRQARAAARKLGPLKDLLGTVPDADVADRAGVSRYAVAQYRKKQGIGSSREPLGQPEGTRVRTTSARTPSKRGLEAYLVHVRGTEERLVVIAADLAEAAATAQAGIASRSGGKGRIEGLEYIGPAL